MIKRDENASNSTSRGRDKAFSKKNERSTPSSNRRSEAAGHGDKKQKMSDSYRSKSSKNHDEPSFSPRSERPTNRFSNSENSFRERTSRKSDDNSTKDNRNFRKREGENSSRRFSDNSSERPKRRFDNDKQERPTRRFDNNDSKERKSNFNSERSQDSNRRFSENSSERPKRRFDSDKPERPSRRFADNDSKERKSFPSDKDRDYKKDRKQNSDQTSNLKPRRRDINAESEILTEIVAKRRESGRLTNNKQQVLSLKWEEENRPIRLNKYISNSGICSRREADKLIETGAILVNDKVVTELGTKVYPTDIVRFEDKILNREKPVYIILNKPKDFITTLEDEKGRKNVMGLIEGACRERVYPVGRLDRNTTGLLLFTNDGEMAKKLTHPRYGVRKIYQVELDKSLSYNDMQTIADGITVDNDVYIKPNDIAYVNPDSKKIIGIEIHSGQNRIVRRIFESLGYEVVKLDRTVYAGLTKKELPRGRWRFLTKEEINILKISIT